MRPMDEIKLLLSENGEMISLATGHKWQQLHVTGTCCVCGKSVDETGWARIDGTKLAHAGCVHHCTIPGGSQ